MDEEPPPKKYSFKAKSIESANPAETPANPSVHDMLQDNLKRQTGVEPEVLITVGDRRTKRARDFRFMVLAGNLLIILAAMILPLNVVVLVYLLAGFVIYNISLVWVMFFVMDKY